MKKFKTLLKPVLTACLFLSLLSLNGCGKKANDSLGMANDRLNAEIPSETEAAMEAVGADSPMETKTDAGTVLKVHFEGEGSAQLNGKINSVVSADTGWLIADTADGKLFLLQPFPDFRFPEDSEVKYSEITDGCEFDSLIYANRNLAYGQDRLVYFEIVGDYADEDVYMLDSLALPEMVYTAENVKQTELSGGRSLLWVSDEAMCSVYADAEGNVRASYNNTVYSDVGIVVDGEEQGEVTIWKGICRFVLTDNQELLYIGSIHIDEDFSGAIYGISLDCTRLTDGADGKIEAIYDCQNDEEACYAVDEDNQIYYIENSWLEADVSTELITRFEYGNITDIQGFGGSPKDILIRTDEDSYYYHGAYDGLMKIEALDRTYKDAVLLMDTNVLALGNDGYLYMIKNPAVQ
ncbi:MAG: hypothetical protein NC337_08010 [Roseburia sp.]|nr:hypothetical protein [Roseburia sp.]